mmetsp:Transcript_36338/g.107995  ORF Transcript_36338/g.107995 Transcript_36338/m.107995 type:complete len:316 (+) Transcript_36338:688-1635(+)
MRSLYFSGRVFSRRRTLRSSSFLICRRYRKSMLLSSTCTVVSPVCLRRPSTSTWADASCRPLSLRCSASREVFAPSPFSSAWPASSSMRQELRLSDRSAFAPVPMTAPSAAAPSRPIWLPRRDRDSSPSFTARAFASSTTHVESSRLWLRLRCFSVEFTATAVARERALRSSPRWSLWSRQSRSRLRLVTSAASRRATPAEVPPAFTSTSTFSRGMTSGIWEAAWATWPAAVRTRAMTLRRRSSSLVSARATRSTVAIAVRRCSSISRHFASATASPLGSSAFSSARRWSCLASTAPSLAASARSPSSPMRFSDM